MTLARNTKEAVYCRDLQIPHECIEITRNMDNSLPKCGVYFSVSQICSCSPQKFSLVYHCSPAAPDLPLKKSCLLLPMTIRFHTWRFHLWHFTRQGTCRLSGSFSPYPPCGTWAPEGASTIMLLAPSPHLLWEQSGELCTAFVQINQSIHRRQSTLNIHLEGLVLALKTLATWCE